MSNTVRGLKLAWRSVNSTVRPSESFSISPRSTGDRALMVLDHGFLNLKAGSRQLLEAQLGALRANGYRIDFLVVYPARSPKQRPLDRKLLQQFPIENAYEAGLDIRHWQVPFAARWMRPSRVPGQRSMAELLAASKAMRPSDEFLAHQQERPYDLIFVNYVWNLPLARKIAGNAPVVVETIDIQSKQIAFWRGPNALKEGLKKEILALTQADGIIALNCDEAEFFRARIPKEKVHLLYPPALVDRFEDEIASLAQACGVRPGVKVPSDLASLDALFLGSRHDPNRRGIVWFIRDVLPKVRTKIPTFKLGVVGPVVEAMRERGDGNLLTADGVITFGPVDRISPLYKAARISVVPVQHGEGISIKTIEAMGYGKAVVTTSVGLRGLTNDIQYPSFDDPSSFAERVIELLQDDTKRQETERLSTSIYEKHFSVNTYNARFGEIMATVRE